MKMFQSNEKGYCKRKQMKIFEKNKIYGLNHETDAAKSSVFDVLYGEEQVRGPSELHNFDTFQLKTVASVNKNSIEK